MRLVLLAAASLSAAAHAGPVTKWDSRTPNAEYVSARAIGDIERCLIDMDGWPVPHVYQQADRPGRIMMLWTDAGGTKVSERLDLESVSTGTRVRSWSKSKQARDCAP